MAMDTATAMATATATAAGAAPSLYISVKLEPQAAGGGYPSWPPKRPGLANLTPQRDKSSYTHISCRAFPVWLPPPNSDRGAEICWQLTRARPIAYRVSASTHTTRRDHAFVTQQRSDPSGAISSVQGACLPRGVWRPGRMGKTSTTRS